VAVITLRRRRTRAALDISDSRTLALAGLAGVTAAAALAVELGRVWRRGSAPLPSEGSAGLLETAETVAAEAVSSARAGYRDVADEENAMFNLAASFVVTFLSARFVTGRLRSRRRVGPFRDLELGRRRIHHFVPGIALAFGSGAAAVVTHDAGARARLAIPFGAGMGLTLDESALLLELDDVYWRPEGVVSVQIALAASALLAALALGLRFVRRGEAIVLEGAGPE
jgi:hypothetical protein